jgi:hypothetical protein
MIAAPQLRISSITFSGTGLETDWRSTEITAWSSPYSRSFRIGSTRSSEALLSLRPVTFHYKKNIDPKGAPQFGLVAEEVEKVNPALVVRDAEGKVFTVRYEAVNAMLLNEFLKAHRKVEQQEATITRLKKDFQSKFAEQQKDFQATALHQQKQIEELTVGLQMVSAKVEMNRPAPQMVLNNQ